MCRGKTRGQTINWDSLELPRIQNDGLDNPFSEEELWEAIKASPAEKAPGPDGFSGTFFRACWGTIKMDVMAAFDHFYSLATGNF
uniref:Reverse transcriptase domain-containing protein n=1 Tax=Aegilops tauschii subsp. strangulata TaxID=200361 RepID=A0A453HP30_AEGTS